MNPKNSRTKVKPIGVDFILNDSICFHFFPLAKVYSRIFVGNRTSTFYCPLLIWFQITFHLFFFFHLTPFVENSTLFYLYFCSLPFHFLSSCLIAMPAPDVIFIRFLLQLSYIPYSRAVWGKFFSKYSVFLTIELNIFCVQNGHTHEVK